MHDAPLVLRKISYYFPKRYKPLFLLKEMRVLWWSRETLKRQLFRRISFFKFTLKSKMFRHAKLFTHIIHFTLSYLKAVIESRQQKEIVLFSIMSRHILRSDEIFVHWITGMLLPRLKRAGRQADQSLIYSAEIETSNAVPSLPQTPSRGAP